MTADEDLEMDLEKEMKKQLARNPRFFFISLGFPLDWRLCRLVYWSGS